MEINSKYYTDDDCTCHCGCGYNVVSPQLISMLDAMSDKAGQKLEVNCICRCPTHNTEVGGVTNSQHVQGTAADVAVTDGWTVDKLGDLAIEMGFDGIGRYYKQDFVHCDIRDGGENPNVYTWTDQD